MIYWVPRSSNVYCFEYALHKVHERRTNKDQNIYYPKRTTWCLMPFSSHYSDQNKTLDQHVDPVLAKSYVVSWLYQIASTKHITINVLLCIKYPTKRDCFLAYPFGIGWESLPSSSACRSTPSSCRGSSSMMTPVCPISSDMRTARVCASKNRYRKREKHTLALKL